MADVIHCIIILCFVVSVSIEQKLFCCLSITTCGLATDGVINQLWCVSVNLVRLVYVLLDNERYLCVAYNQFYVDQKVVQWLSVIGITIGTILAQLSPNSIPLCNYKLSISTSHAISSVIEFC